MNICYPGLQSSSNVKRKTALFFVRNLHLTKWKLIFSFNVKISPKKLKVTSAEHKTCSKYAVKLMKNLTVKAQLIVLP